jgi:uncharacterized damage-inducible protein DinB
MNKTEFTERNRRSRDAWQAALTRFNAGNMEQPLPDSDWTVKDLVAHVTWYEQEMLDLLQQRRFAGSELWGLPNDERNAVIYAANRDRPVEDVLSQAREVSSALFTLLEQLSEDDLINPAHFPGMPEDWQPWEVLADNTYLHYEAHTSQVKTDS